MWKATKLAAVALLLVACVAVAGIYDQAIGIPVSFGITVPEALEGGAALTAAGQTFYVNWNIHLTPVPNQAGRWQSQFIYINPDRSIRYSDSIKEWGTAIAGAHATAKTSSGRTTVQVRFYYLPVHDPKTGAQVGAGGSFLYHTVYGVFDNGLALPYSMPSGFLDSHPNAYLYKPAQITLTTPSQYDINEGFTLADGPPE